MKSKKKGRQKERKTKLTEKEVRHVAFLAGLELDVNKVKKFQVQLGEVLDYIEKLKKLKTGKVKPTNQITGLENVFRKDETSPGFSQKEALSGTKRRHKGFFKIEAIFDEI